MAIGLDNAALEGNEFSFFSLKKGLGTTYIKHTA